MCLICMKDNVFTGRDLTTLERARSRMLKVKQLLTDAENEELCTDGDNTIESLKREQYELARQL